MLYKYNGSFLLSSKSCDVIHVEEGDKVIVGFGEQVLKVGPGIFSGSQPLRHVFDKSVYLLRRFGNDISERSSPTVNCVRSTSVARPSEKRISHFLA